jgi:hypothetical protein
MKAVHERLRAIAGAAVTQPWQLEGSVRRGESGLRAGRVMLESVPFSVVAEVAAALDVPVPPGVVELAQRANAEGLPLIAGWDIGDAEPRAKLYLNASDAAPAVRTRLATAALEGRAAAIADPHVIGVDLHRTRPPELKLYRQDRDAERLAGVAGPAATSLARRALDAGACAGAVLSWNSDSTLRAFFIATRAGAERGIEALVAALPGWERAPVPALLGFEPGAARSIGLSVADPSQWTVYFKQRGVAPLAQLEAAACFRTGAVEVGLFIEPASLVPRAYARTRAHALSFRAREGQPAPHDIEALMAWAFERVTQAERAGGPVDAALRSAAPPAPWREVSG